MANMSNNAKGYNMQVAVEMLGGVLPALITSNEVTTVGKFHNPTLIMAINISFFQDVEAFKQRVDERIRDLKASERMPGVDEILIPGERG